MDFQDLEAVEGLRFSWNAWPTTRLEASRCGVPFGIICQPVQNIADLPRLPYSPLRCKSCQAVLNPFCPVDFDAKTWACCICTTINSFPKSHSTISETNLPAELFPTHNVVEYFLPRAQPARPPSVVFVVDVAGPKEDLDHISQALLKALSSLPSGVHVGLITFGSMVSLHLLLPSKPLTQAVVCQGSKPCAHDQIEDLIAGFSAVIRGESSPTLTDHPGEKGRDTSELNGQSPKTCDQVETGHGWDAASFLAPVEQCRGSIEQALQQLHPDPCSATRSLRPKRVTGSAIAAALALLEAGVPEGSPGRIVTVLSGACTAGPGLVVEREYSDLFRSHHDLQTDRTLHFRTATAYYTALGSRLSKKGFTLDSLACCADQVGLAEMRPAVEGTGGTMLLTDSADSDSFSGTLLKLFRRDQQGQLETCHGAEMQVRTSEGLRIAGAVGPCMGVKPRDKGMRLGQGQCKWVSETNKVGESGTWMWRVPCLSPSSAVGIVLDVSSLSPGDISPDSTLFLQLQTEYTDSSGVRRLRICTVGRRWKMLKDLDPLTTQSEALEDGDYEGGDAQGEAAASLLDLVTGFDQEAASALVSKIAVVKMESQSPEAVVRWLDRMLVRFGARFGRFTPNMPPSFVLTSNLLSFPSFVYHLRRSPFLQIFNCSPDDSAFRRVALLREGVPNSLLMVQPSLLSFTLNNAPQLMPLDLTSVHPENILLYDSFFEVVVHQGSTIAQHKRAGLQQDPSQSSFQRLLEEPVEAAKAVARERWLEPRLILCEQNDSLSRFLTYRLSPAPVQLSTTNEDSRMSYISTDDISLQSFISQFQNMVVQS